MVAETYYYTHEQVNENRRHDRRHDRRHERRHDRPGPAFRNAFIRVWRRRAKKSAPWRITCDV